MHVVDVSAQKCGLDLTLYPPAVDGRQPEVRHIEVKGQVNGATTVTITRNEILYTLNQSEKFQLALVTVALDNTTKGPFYIYTPFAKEPGWGASVNYDPSDLLSRSVLDES
jgi:Domain of unknown function (DUF3883)